MNGALQAEDAALVLAVASAGHQCTSVEAFLAEIGRLFARPPLVAERLFVSMQTLHPACRARTYLRDASHETVKVIEWPHGLKNRPGYFDSPDYHVHASREELRVADLQNVGPHQCDLYGKLRAAGYTDYLIVPLAFSDGTINTLSIATRRAAGFSDAALDSFRTLTALIAVVLERFAAVEAMGATLGTYLGRNASQQVMRGKIRAGHGELVKAAVLLADLQGFTALAARLAPAGTVRLLNDYFDCVVGPIEQHGGYVLKFIGDAVLGFFPVDLPELPEPEPIATVHGMRDRLAKLNQVRSAKGEPLLRHGVALHFGDMVYGNIGSSERLDFTIVGEAVNVTARCLEATRSLSHDYLFTEAFAQRFGRTGLRSIGQHRLRGIDTSVELLGLRPDGEIHRAHPLHPAGTGAGGGGI